MLFRSVREEICADSLAFLSPGALLRAGNRKDLCMACFTGHYPTALYQNEVKELKEYIEEVFADYNDINDDTRTQLELINQTLAELQAQKALADKPRNPIGFVTPKKKE